MGYDINGKRIREHTTWSPDPGMTARQIEKELNRQAILFEERCKTQQVHSGNVKLADFAEQWLKDYAEKQLKPTTIATYRTFLPRINAALGHIRLDKLQPHHLLSFYSNLDEDGIRLDTTFKSKEDFKQFLKNRGFTQAAFCQKYSIGHGIVESYVPERTSPRPVPKKLRPRWGVPSRNCLTPSAAVPCLVKHNFIIIVFFLPCWKRLCSGR